MRTLCFICLVFLTFSCKKDNPLPGPTGLAITNVSDTGATVSWNPVSGAKSYILSVGNEVHTISADTTGAITLTDLTPMTTYAVKLVAVGNNGPGGVTKGTFTTEDADALVIVGSSDDNVYAFNARDGHKVWQYTTGGQVVATPIIQDSVVYIGSLDSRLYALGLQDGDLKWASAQTFSGTGITAPVTISNGTIYFGDFGGGVYAFDQKSGVEKWQYILTTPYRNINSAPVMSADSTLFYIASYDGRIYAFNASTGGTPLWFTPSTGNPLSSGPALYNNTIYVGANPGLYAFDATTGAQKWRSGITGPEDPGMEDYDASPTISDNKVLIGDEYGYFHAFDATTGATVWSLQLSPASITSSAFAAGGIEYVGGGDGDMLALDIATGNTVWSTNISAKNIYDGPTVTAKYLYAITLDGNLYCLQRATGIIRWVTSISTSIPDYTAGYPTITEYSGGVIYAGVTGYVQ